MTHPLATPLQLQAPICIRVWGERAIFTRYDTPSERDTYPILTVPAAEAILKKVFWHPGIDYEIQRIHIMRPVELYSHYGSELKDHPPGGGRKPTNSALNRTLRLRRFIHQPDYVIEARMALSPEAQMPGNRTKYEHMLQRRLSRGQCFEQPYFGMRECPAHFEQLQPGNLIEPWDADAELGQLPLHHSYRPHVQGETYYREHILDGVSGRWTVTNRRGDLVAHFFGASVERGTLHVPPYREGAP